ncbi:MAG: cytochrome c3 family protein [Desulfuromonadaceae bacterium]
MGHSAKFRIGTLLVGAGLLNQQQLDRALEGQKHGNERIGDTLIRNGVLKAVDLTTPLIVQEHLSTIESAVKLAAGERLLFGQLLVKSGHISQEQLDQAIAEHQQTGEKLADILRRFGTLTGQQLNGLLAFQQNQDSTHVSPLRLGELLVSTGRIAREQLEDALLRQKQSDKNIGQVLLESGYATPACIQHCVSLQKMLTKIVLAAILALGSGAEGHAGEMCTFSTQLQDPAMRAQYVAKVASETGNMVAYNTVSDATVASDADESSVSSFFFGTSTSVKNQGSSTLDSFSQDCLGCHDGFQASDRKVNYKNTPGQKSHWSQGASEHPIGMNYASYAAMDPKSYKPVSSFGSKMMFVNGRVGCTTCHDPLNPEKSHMAKSDYRSALCLTCHTK